MPTIKNGLVIPDGHVNIIPDPWKCATCKRTYQEQVRKYIEWNGSPYCCSKCFRTAIRKYEVENKC
jgi:hypothetical protein